MSFANDDEFAAFIGRDHMLLAVTPEAVANALEGFALQLAPGRDMDWLAMAVRRSLGISLRSRSDSPDRTSNVDIKAALARLVNVTETTWQELFGWSDAVDSRLWTVAWRRWDGEAGNVSEPPEYRRVKAAVSELNWLAGFLRLAAEDTPIPRGPWRDKERKWIRIERGQYLAVIYEAAFGQPVSANNFPTDSRIKSQTHFMDFYGRMVTLAFGMAEAVNLTEVVKAACQRHREHPAEFGDGIIPGL